MCNVTAIDNLHWNENIVILAKFSSLAIVNAVKMTTYSAASDWFHQKGISVSVDDERWMPGFNIEAYG